MSDFEKCLASAQRSLAMREHSSFQIKNKLTNKGFDSDTIESVILEIKNKGFQSDERYTEEYIRYRQNSGYGSKKIIYELKSNGISSELIKDSIKNFIDDYDVLSKLAQTRITDIDLDKRRIAVSHKLTTENPWEKFKKEVSVGSIISGEIIGTNEYALFVKLDKYSIEAFLHSNDLHFLNNPEEEIKKYKKGEKFEKLKVLEVDPENQKIRVSLREAISEDPFKFYENYKEGDVLTCKVVSIENKGLSVKPEGCEIETFIKKSQLAISPGDQRPGRWTQGDRVDCLLEKKSKKSISLSIRALDEKLNADALEKYGDSGSGKSLPFASLSDKIDKKKKSE